jgi:hypothetical protein
MNNPLSKTKILIALCVTFLIPAIGRSQEIVVPEKVKMHHEVHEGTYVPVDLDKMPSSPAYKSTSSSIFTTQVNVNSSGENITGDAANEPSIAIDPTNPDRMMIGWRQFSDVNNSFRQAGYGYSLDGGQNWTFPGMIEPGVFRSDPVLDCDAYGVFYYNSLTVDNDDNFWCDVFKIDDGGVEWDEGTFAHGGDKQWMRVDKGDGIGEGKNYSNWTKYYSICYPNFFTRSVDIGVTYEPCVNIPGEPYWGTLAIGPESELYIVGAGDNDDVFMTRSVDARFTGSDVTFDLYTPVDLDGYLTGWTAVNPQGLLGQAWIDVDVSDGPGRGNIYVLSSVKRNTGGDPGDVMFARSTDGGLTFDPPVRVNDDPTTQKIQWFGTMSVAPNGRIDAVWLDNRVDIFGGYNSALFYSYSLDQGATWSVNEQLSEMFDPHVGWPQQEKMGDYFEMISDEGGAHLAWANTLNGEQDVYYSYINPLGVGIADVEDDRSFMSLLNYPNPFNDHTSLQYTLAKESNIRIAVYDIYGREVKEILSQRATAGTHTVNYSASELPDGVYICKLQAGNRAESVRIVKVGGKR